MTDNTKQNNTIDHKKNKSPFSKRNKLARIVWNTTYLLFFKHTPDFILNKYRVFLLKIFGAKIGTGSVIYPTAKIWAPWNLEIGEFTCIGPDTDIYSMDKIIIGNHVTISQNAVICTGSHDVFSHSMRLISRKVTVDNYAWVCAYAKVLPGSFIGEGSVVGLNCIISKSTEPWYIYAGNPAKKIKARVITHD